MVPSKKVRKDILNDLLTNPEVFQEDNEQGAVLTFLSSIWDLRKMPSTDSRYKNAYDDINQHMVRNEDWDYRYLFIERLNLLEADDDEFAKFLEAIVSPKFRQTEERIFRYVLLINDYIDKDGIILAVDDYNDFELPVHRIKPKAIFEHAPSDLKRNVINFYVQKNVLGRSNSVSSHKTPPKFPSFVLAFNDGWNDYSKKTSFDLFYYRARNSVVHLGPLKIIVKDSSSVGDMENTILEMLPASFTELDESYCTLGMNDSYYEKLNSVLKRNFESALFALRDIAFYPENRERFESNPLLSGSLFRNEDDERRARQVRYKLYGYDLTRLYKFKYFFTPLYSDGDAVDVTLDFSGDGEIPSRIFALIGKNGTGKTQLISSLPLHISQKNDKLFSPRAPLFSKIIAVSYSIFDRFEIPRKNSSFNYVYCGLRNEKGNIASDRGQTQRFHNTWKKIKDIGRVGKWRKILLLFLDKSIVDEMIVYEESDDSTVAVSGYTVNIAGVSSARGKLSSGQNILLNQISEIVANIMYDSLILFDEPETHLHPNAVSQLMNTIYELVNEFQSYCLIATHSPIVIRELFSKNVFVIERHENVASVRRVGMESFGENLSVLTEDVFGNREIPKHYKEIIEDLADRRYSFEEIVKLLETTGSPLSLNARLYLRTLFP